MNHISIKNAKELALVIESQLNGSEKFRLFKKLYTILLVARHPNNNCSEIARLLGISPHTVARWVGSISTENGFDLTHLNEKDIPGRPGRMNENQLCIIKDAIKESPKEKQLHATKWTGKLLSDYIKREFYIDIQVRQCQKLLVRLSAKKSVVKNY